jgi:hypothetical protein
MIPSLNHLIGTAIAELHRAPPVSAQPLVQLLLRDAALAIPRDALEETSKSVARHVITLCSALGGLVDLVDLRYQYARNASDKKLEVIMSLHQVRQVHQKLDNLLEAILSSTRADMRLPDQPKPATIRDSNYATAVPVQPLAQSLG